MCLRDRPYVAYFNNGIVEVNVGMADEHTDKDNGYTTLFDLLVATVSNSYSEDLAGKAASLLQKFKKLGKADRYISETNEFAAALTFVTLYFSEMTQEPSKVAELFHADVERMSVMVMAVSYTHLFFTASITMRPGKSASVFFRSSRS